jgi:hypothetical protein
MYECMALVNESTSCSRAHYLDGSVCVWFRSVTPHTYTRDQIIDVVQKYGSWSMGRTFGSITAIMIS